MGEVSSVIGSNTEVGTRIVGFLGLDKLQEFFESVNFVEYVGPFFASFIAYLFTFMIGLLVVKVILHII